MSRASGRGRRGWLGEWKVGWVRAACGRVDESSACECIMTMCSPLLSAKDVISTKCEKLVEM